MENIDKTPGLEHEVDMLADKEPKDIEVDPGSKKTKHKDQKKVTEVQEKMELDKISDKIDDKVQDEKPEKNIEDAKEMDIDPGNIEANQKIEKCIQIEDVKKMDLDPVGAESLNKDVNLEEEGKNETEKDLNQNEEEKKEDQSIPANGIQIEDLKKMDVDIVSIVSLSKEGNLEGEGKNETEKGHNPNEEEKKEDKSIPANPETESSNTDLGGAYYISHYSSLTSHGEKNLFLRNNPQAKLAVEFNYEFDKKQKLVDIDTKEPFKFTNQADYEKLGKVVQKCIEYMMTHKYGLNRVSIPLDSEETPKSYIYVSPNFNNPETQHPKALLLIQGAGAVRPGIWARSVCINDTLKTGSMNSFLSFANKNKFEVIIFNPNKTRSKGKPIPKNSSLEQHGKYIWERFIRASSPHDLYIVAHSCGGVSTVSLMDLFWPEFKERVKGIAFTDAVHGYYGMKKDKIEFCRRRAVDWVASHQPLDTVESKKKDGIVFLSSGHHKHEYTTGSARKSIKTYLLQIDERNPYL